MYFTLSHSVVFSVVVLCSSSLRVRDILVNADSFACQTARSKSYQLDKSQNTYTHTQRERVSEHLWRVSGSPFSKSNLEFLSELLMMLIVSMCLQYTLYIADVIFSLKLLQLHTQKAIEREREQRRKRMYGYIGYFANSIISVLHTMLLVGGENKPRYCHIWLLAPTMYHNAFHTKNSLYLSLLLTYTFSINGIARCFKFFFYFCHQFSIRLQWIFLQTIFKVENYFWPSF